LLDRRKLLNKLQFNSIKLLEEELKCVKNLEEIKESKEKR